ncbi:uncharacterized protein [Ptychodera flava]|uniref:uncharacterized protein n=1 Tax=Ptychodera flava TaxID=63121 RepID=UPI003969D118
MSTESKGDLRTVIHNRRGVVQLQGNYSIAQSSWSMSCQNDYDKYHYRNPKYYGLKSRRESSDQKDDLSHIKIKTLDEIRREKQANKSSSHEKHVITSKPENELWNSFKDKHAHLTSGTNNLSSKNSGESADITWPGKLAGEPEISVSCNNGRRSISTKGGSKGNVNTTVTQPAKPDIKGKGSLKNVSGNFKVPPLPTRIIKFPTQGSCLDSDTSSTPSTFPGTGAVNMNSSSAASHTTNIAVTPGMVSPLSVKDSSQQMCISHNQNKPQAGTDTSVNKTTMKNQISLKPGVKRFSRRINADRVPVQTVNKARIVPFTKLKNEEDTKVQSRLITSFNLDISGSPAAKKTVLQQSDYDEQDGYSIPPQASSPLQLLQKSLFPSFESHDFDSNILLKSPKKTSVRTSNPEMSKKSSPTFKSPVTPDTRDYHDWNIQNSLTPHEKVGRQGEKDEVTPHQGNNDADFSKSGSPTQGALEPTRYVKIKEEPKSEENFDLSMAFKGNGSSEGNEICDSGDDDVLFCVSDSGSNSEEERSDSGHTNTSSFYVEEDTLSLFAPANYDDLLGDPGPSNNFRAPKTKMCKTPGNQQRMKGKPESISQKRSLQDVKNECNKTDRKRMKISDNEQATRSPQVASENTMPRVVTLNFKSKPQNANPEIMRGQQKTNQRYAFQEQFQAVKKASLSTVTCQAFGKTTLEDGLKAPCLASLRQVNRHLSEKRPCDAWNVILQTPSYLNSDITVLSRILKSCEESNNRSVPEVAMAVFEQIQNSSGTVPSMENFLTIIKVLCRHKMIKRALSCLYPLIINANVVREPAVLSVIDDITERLIMEKMWTELHDVVLMLIEAEVKPNDNTLSELIVKHSKDANYGAICNLIDSCGRKDLVPGKEPFMKALRALKMWGGDINAYNAAKALFFEYYPRDSRPDREGKKTDRVKKMNAIEPNLALAQPKQGTDLGPQKTMIDLGTRMLQNQRKLDACMNIPLLDCNQNINTTKNSKNSTGSSYTSQYTTKQVVSMDGYQSLDMSRCSNESEKNPRRSQNHVSSPEKQHYIKKIQSVTSLKELSTAYVEMRSNCPEVIDLDVKNEILKVLTLYPHLAGDSFEEFMTIAKQELKTEELATEDKEVVAYLGVGLQDTCYQNKLWTQGLKVLHVLHNNNIYYATFAVGQDGSAIQPNCTIVLKSMKICLELELADNALEIIKASGWKEPNPDDHTEKVLYSEIFQTLAKAMMKKKDIMSSWNVIQHLAAVNKEYLDEKTYSSLLNDLVHVSMQSGELETALKVYKHMKSKKVAVSRHTVSSLILGIHNSGRTLPARQMFLEACLEGVYPKQHMHEDPYKLMLVVSFSKIELTFIIEEYLKDLGKFLLYTTTEPVSFDVAIVLCNISDQGEMQELQAGSRGIREEKQKIVDVLYYELSPPLNMRPGCNPSDPCLYVTRESVDNWMRVSVADFCQLPYIKPDDDDGEPAVANSDSSEFDIRKSKQPPPQFVVKDEEELTAGCQQWEPPENQVNGEVPNHLLKEEKPVIEYGAHLNENAVIARPSELKFVRDYNHGINNVEIVHANTSKEGQMYDICGRISLLPNAAPNYPACNRNAPNVHDQWQPNNINSDQAHDYRLKPLSPPQARFAQHRESARRIYEPRAKLPPFSSWSSHHREISLRHNSMDVSDPQISNSTRLNIIVFRDKSRQDIFSKLAEYVREGHVPEDNWHIIARDLHRTFMEEEYNCSSGQLQYTEDVGRKAELIVDQYVQRWFQPKRHPFRPS